MVYLCTLDEGDDSYADERRAVDAASAKAKAVRMVINGGFHFESEPVSEEGAAGAAHAQKGSAADGISAQTRAQLMIKLDLRIPFLPSWLFDMLVKNFASAVIPMWNKQASKFSAGGKLHHLMSAERDCPVYDELQRRLAVLQS